MSGYRLVPEGAAVVCAKCKQELFVSSMKHLLCGRCQRDFGPAPQPAEAVQGELVRAAKATMAAFEDSAPIRGKDDDYIYDALGSMQAAAYFAARDALANAAATKDTP